MITPYTVSSGTGRAVVDVLTEARALPRLQDRHVSPRGLTAYMLPSGEVFLQTSDRTYTLHENALSQFFAKIGYPDHRAMNERLGTATKNQMIRELCAWRNSAGGAVFQKDLLLRLNPCTQEVVAFLSSRYNPFDNHEVADDVEIGLAGLGGEYKNQLVVIDELGDYAMRMVVAFPDVEVSSPDGRGCWVGLAVSNDETGNGSVKLSPAIYRWVCLNGMVSCQQLLSLRSYHTKQKQTVQQGIANVIQHLPRFVTSWKEDAQRAFNSPCPTFTNLRQLQEYIGKTEISKVEACEILTLWAVRAQVEGVLQYNLYQLAQAVSFLAAYRGKRRQELERLSHHLIHRGY